MSRKKAVKKSAVKLTCKGSSKIVTVRTNNPYEIGGHYLVRTGTMIDTGTVVHVTDTEIVLKDAAWIADTGRWSDALVNPSSIFREVEPFPKGAEVIVGRTAVIDAVKIPVYPLTAK